MQLSSDNSRLLVCCCTLLYFGADMFLYLLVTYFKDIHVCRALFWFGRDSFVLSCVFRWSRLLVAGTYLHSFSSSFSKCPTAGDQGVEDMPLFILSKHNIWQKRQLHPSQSEVVHSTSRSLGEVCSTSMSMEEVYRQFHFQFNSLFIMYQSI